MESEEKKSTKQPFFYKKTFLKAHFGTVFENILKQNTLQKTARY